MTNKPRTRSIPEKTAFYAKSQVYTSSGVPVGPPGLAKVSPFTATLQAVLISSGHPISKIHKSKRYRGKHPRIIRTTTDIGGDFRTSRVTIINYPWSYRDRQVSLGAYTDYEGTVMATSITASSPSPASYLNPSSSTQLASYGATGIAKCIPTNPLANTGQFLAELKDLPHVFNPLVWIDTARNLRRSPTFAKAWKAGKFVAKQGSGDYLNYQFGWVPMISDIFQFIDVSLKAQRVIQQLERDSGQNVRRGSKILSSTSVQTPTSVTGRVPFPGAAPFTTTGTLTTQITETQDVWFKGCFTYYLPPVDGSVSSYFNRYRIYAHKLYGLQLDLDLLWKITPWSWAIDWFTNTGDVVRNWSSFSNTGLVLRYGYVMETKTKLTTYTLQGAASPRIKVPPLVSAVQQVTKSRSKATPYGFGLNPGSFTPFQNSIIAALGINRAARWL